VWYRVLVADSVAIMRADLGATAPAPVAAHDGHGCCQDPCRRRFPGDTSGRRSLIGVRETRVPVGMEWSGLTVVQPEAVVVSLRCKSWRCVCCARRLRARNRARAFMGASGQRCAMVTLTVDPRDPRLVQHVATVWAAGAGAAIPAGISAERLRASGSIDYVRKVAWKRFRTYFGREFGAAPWFRGLELTRAGVAHIHWVVRVESVQDFARLRALVRGSEVGRSERHRAVAGWQQPGAGLAERAGFGIVSDVQLARSSGDVARYVTKATASAGIEAVSVSEMRPGVAVAAYVTKGVADLRMPKYTRRASWSTGDRAPWAPLWRKPERLGGFSRWRVASAGVEAVTRALVASGRVVIGPDGLGRSTP